MYLTPTRYLRTTLRTSASLKLVERHLFLNSPSFYGLLNTGCIEMDTLHVVYDGKLLCGVFPIPCGHIPASTTYGALFWWPRGTYPQQPVFLRAAKRRAVPG